MTLDACLMDELGRCGAGACLTQVKHSISVARRVMKKMPHVLLVGEGALGLAIAEDLTKDDLLTAYARRAWEKWKRENAGVVQPQIHVENHDTMGMVALDQDGRLSGACTASGLAFKMAVRVGDSPIIRVALYVDQEVGAEMA